jgi:tRNA/tmRNA/rRNA uracil-C5-methylase (TrmA/RlmC/RlmD family)
MASFKNEDGYILPNYKWFKYTVTDSIKRYKNCQHKLLKVSKCANALINYLSENMDSDNSFIHTKKLRDDFRSFISKIAQINYSDATVKRALKELTDASLLIKMGPKSEYRVNPLHFFQGSEKSREELLKELCRKSETRDFRSNIKEALGL